MRSGRQLDCEHDTPACRGRSWDTDGCPVSGGLTRNLTDLRSSLLICRSTLAGESYGNPADRMGRDQCLPMELVGRLLGAVQGGDGSGGR